MPGVVCGYHLSVVTPDARTYGPFLKRFFDTKFAKACFAVLANGLTRVGLGQYAIDNVELPFPPNSEQIAICAFLDRETAKVDALAEGQQRLIALLKEKRQAVISAAVTKGLDPNAPMKDSGVEWLGEVPVHWRVGALKHFVRARAGAIKSGPFGSQLTSAEMQSGSIKVYNQRNVIDGDFESGDNFISDEKFSALSSFETFPGDVLVSTRGTIGRASILPKNATQGILHPCVIRVQPEPSMLNGEFLRSLIQDSNLLRTQIDLMSNATTIDVIYSETMASLFVPVPPLEEQGAISAYLERTNGQFDALIREAETAIALLQERRSALISAAVTGKIDVRGLAPIEAEAA
jgi:type I restriction enzyme S subunit